LLLQQDTIGVATPAVAGNAFGMSLGGLANAGVNQFNVAASGLGINPMGGISQGNQMNMNQMLQNSNMSIGSNATANGNSVAQFQNQKYELKKHLPDVDLDSLKPDAIRTCAMLDNGRRSKSRFCAHSCWYACVSCAVLSILYLFGIFYYRLPTCLLDN